MCNAKRSSNARTTCFVERNRAHDAQTTIFVERTTWLPPGGWTPPLRPSLKHFDARTSSFAERNEICPRWPQWRRYRGSFGQQRREQSRHTDLGRRIEEAATKSWQGRQGRQDRQRSRASRAGRAGRAGKAAGQAEQAGQAGQEARRAVHPSTLEIP